MGKRLKWIEKKWNSDDPADRILGFSGKVAVEAALFLAWAIVGGAIGALLAYPNPIPFEPIQGGVAVFSFTMGACVKQSFCSIIRLDELNGAADDAG